MAVLRVIVIFLLGAGFAAGAYMTGVAQRIPHYFSHDLNDAPFVGARSAPVALNITSASQGERSACPPEYRIHNRTGGPVYFSFGRQAGVQDAQDGIVLPPGEVLDPAGDVGAIHRDRLEDDSANCADLVDIDIDSR